MRELTILVVIDLNAGAHQPALERAAWLATRARGRLELFACDYDPLLDTRRLTTVWGESPGPRERVLLRRRSQLEELAAPLRKQGLAVTVDVVWDHPFEAAIVKKVAAHDYWLVAKDTHHHNLIQRTLLTNVDWLLIRECVAPLLLVKDRTLAAEPVVLAAVDPLNEYDKPAALDERILRFAAEIARLTHGHLHVMHSFAPPIGAEYPPAVVEVIAQEHRVALTRFLDTHAALGGRRHLYQGLPHESLRKAAVEHAADLVVMGAIARRGLKRLFIGSTAERVLDRLPCDLLIIKPLELEVPHDVD